MLALGLAAATLAPIHAPQSQKPNVIYILADDLGYGELGCYGQKDIKTPNIDRLAAEGMKFTQHYSGSPVCAPTRCTIMTGKSTRTNWVRENWEAGDFTPDGKEGQDPLPANTFTIGKLMQNAGYVTAAIGKWGLGGPDSTGIPNNQGFDYYFGYLCQRQAHNYYPTHLWENTNYYPLNNPKYNAHQQFPLGLDAFDPANYLQYSGKQYSNDVMTNKALNFIDQNKSKPFFLYLAYTIPHLSLQVPEDSVDPYLGKFLESPYLGKQGYLPNMHPKSAYAGMISRLDRYVGQVLAMLKRDGLDQNTLVVFTSDNGPSWVGGVDPSYFNSTKGLRGRKAQLWEGGIRVPMLARWPGKIQPGTQSNLISAQWDTMATLSQLTGSKIQGETESVSYLPTLLGENSQAHHKWLYWEFVSHRAGQAVRIGDFKAIKFNRGPKDAKDIGHVYVYDLKIDPAEMADVSANHPEIVSQAEKIMASRMPAHLKQWNWDTPQSEAERIRQLSWQDD